MKVGCGFVDVSSIKPETLSRLDTPFFFFRCTKAQCFCGDCQLQMMHQRHSQSPGEGSSVIKWLVSVVTVHVWG